MGMGNDSSVTESDSASVVKRCCLMLGRGARHNRASPYGPPPMSPAPDSPRPRSWLRFQFSLGTLFWLMLVVGIVIAWWKDRSSVDERLTKLEQMVAPTQQTLWGVADILGAPDDPIGTA